MSAVFDRLFCSACGPNAAKCLKANPRCSNPRVVLAERAHDNATRAHVLASRKRKDQSVFFIFNYYDYGYDYFSDDDDGGFVDPNFL